jgi:hypothetical protein
MATLSELGQSFQALDPYAEFRKGGMSAQKFDIQQAVLDEQTKEIEADKQAEAGLAQQAGQMGQPVKLAKMANQMIPDAKLYNDDGTLTTAGQMNDMMVNSQKLAKQAKMMNMQAALIEDPYQRTQAMAEARRLGQTAQGDMLKVREINEKVKGDSIYAAAMAKDQTQWDAAIQAYQDSGLPLPKGIPTEYTPENAKKIAALAPASLQSKINNDILKRDQEARLVKSAELRDQKMAASLRDGGKGNGFRSAIIEQRQDTLAINATEFVRTLLNITELPAESTSGIFGGKTAGSLFTAPVEAAANTLTSDSVQRYNSEMGGLGNHLAWMVSGGLSPSAGVQEKFESILKIKEGDSQAAVLGKLARARQEAENVLAVKMKSRLMSDEMKVMLKELDNDLQKAIPFTVKDVNKWANAKDKKETFGQFMAKTVGGESVNVGGKTYTRPPNMSEQDWNDYKASVGASK